MELVALHATIAIEEMTKETCSREAVCIHRYAGVQGFAKACALLFQVLAETVVTVVSEDYEVMFLCQPHHS